MRLVGQSSVFQDTVRLLTRIAQFDISALIEGETGTGKELAARFVHQESPRRDRPFVPVNCGALPDALVENELFGHERGAYTDARQPSAGVIARADGGTLFLDEVDALSPKAQVALLRFLQDQHYRPVGASRDRRVDVRIIAASNQSLSRLARQGLFRSDLLFRIKVMSVELPPLRVRRGDPRLLADYFLQACSERYRCTEKRLHASTLEWIDRHDWPGNVRELENLIHRGFLLSEGPDVIVPEAPLSAEPPDSVPALDPEALEGDYKTAKAAAVSAFNRQFLATLLARTCGNVTKAALEAKKDRRALGRLLKRYGFRPMDFRIPSSS